MHKNKVKFISYFDEIVLGERDVWIILIIQLNELSAMC